MRKYSLKKGLAYSIIFLFIGGMFIPIGSGYIQGHITNNSPVASQSNDWMMFRNDPGNTGYSSSLAPNTNHLAWTYETEKNTYSSNAAIVGNKAYLATNGGLYCLEADSGEFVWLFNPGGTMHSSPAVVNGKVYVTASVFMSSGRLYCIDAESGDENWNRDISVFAEYSPIVDDGKVYVTSYGDYFGTVHCFDVDDGESIWSHELDGGYFVSHAPAVYNGKFYFAPVDFNSYQATLTCLNANNGNFVWDYPIGISVFGESPAVADGMVYVSGLDSETWNDGRLYCLNSLTGDLHWEFVTPEEWPASAVPAVSGLKVIFCTWDNMYCVNTLTGNEIWHTPIDHTQSSPVIADDKVYCADDDGVFCLDIQDGSLIWNYALNHDTGPSPSIGDGRLYIADEDGTVYAFEDEFKIGEISGGFVSVKAEIRNGGEKEIPDVSWSLNVAGGLLGLINKTSSGSIPLLEAGSSEIVTVSPVFGLGPILVKISASAPGFGSTSKTKNGFVLGPIVLML